jgi:tRNA(adenine34) deaminase
MTDRDEQMMRLAVDQAELAKLNGDFPFGAVMTWRDKVLVMAENRESRDADVTRHAEIVAVSESSRKLGRRDLSDCVLYSSCEPCPMCSAAIFQSNIPRVVFGIYREDLPHIFRRRKIRIAQLAEDWDYRPEVVGGVLREVAVASFDGIVKSSRVVPQYHSESPKRLI